VRLAALETRVVSGNSNLGALDTGTSESSVSVCIVRRGLVSIREEGNQ
jgi:hypothetical protein